MMQTEIRDVLGELAGCKRALILGHSHPDGDCAGSAVALAGLVEALGGSAEVMFPEPLPLRLRFLLAGRPERTALPENLADYTLICVDVAAPVQLGSLSDPLSGKVRLLIDHHDVGTPYTQLRYVDAKAAAAGEIVFSLCEAALESGMVRALPQAVYDALFGAVSSDTGCFRYGNVTPATHRCAAKLLEYGADAEKINRLLFDTKSKTELYAEGLAHSRLVTFADGKISGIAIGRDDYKNGVQMSDFETAVDVARSLRGATVAIVVKETPAGGKFRVSLRGNDGVNVCRVAETFGGGGHIVAAGCTVEAADKDAALALLVKRAEELCL